MPQCVSPALLLLPLPPHISLLSAGGGPRGSDPATAQAGGDLLGIGNKLARGRDRIVCFRGETQSPVCVAGFAETRRFAVEGSPLEAGARPGDRWRLSTAEREETTSAPAAQLLSAGVPGYAS